MSNSTLQATTTTTSELISAVDSWSSSFSRLTLPSGLLGKSEVTEILDEGAKLLSITLMYGERTGKLDLVGYDDSEIQDKISDLNVESLWIYDTAKTLNIPPEFKEIKQDAFLIHTGKIRKCPTCRGHGKVRCSACKGKVRWTEYRGKTSTEYTCSCGDGKELCDICTGYGKTETVIRCHTSYKITTRRSQEYEGEVPKADLDKTTGRVLLEEVIEYPQHLMREMLQGGLDPTEYMELQEHVCSKVHGVINNKLKLSYDGNLQLVHDLTDQFFTTMPNPVEANILLENEVIPVRMRVKVEDSPVHQINYTYKSKPYELWVYGNERRIFAFKQPSEFTYKLGIVLIAGFMMLGLFFYLVSVS